MELAKKKGKIRELVAGDGDGSAKRMELIFVALKNGLSLTHMPYRVPINCFSNSTITEKNRKKLLTSGYFK